MSQSISKNYLHLVFSTKNRIHSLPSKHLKEIFCFMADELKRSGNKPICIGGVTNHVHILFELSRKKALSDVVRMLKCNTSKRINDLKITPCEFHWQDGYGAFSVNKKNIPLVCKYINNQEAHHNTQEFRDEYISFLKVHNIKFNENDIEE